MFLRSPHHERVASALFSAIQEQALLAELRGKTPAQTANELGITLEVVEDRLKRAKAKFPPEQRARYDDMLKPAEAVTCAEAARIAGFRPAGQAPFSPKAA